MEGVSLNDELLENGPATTNARALQTPPYYCRLPQQNGIVNDDPRSSGLGESWAWITSHAFGST
jgi:hypothetical protein